jgi:hypothetical protein
MIENFCIETTQQDKIVCESAFNSGYECLKRTVLDLVSSPTETESDDESEGTSQRMSVLSLVLRTDAFNMVQLPLWDSKIQNRSSLRFVSVLETLVRLCVPPVKMLSILVDPERFPPPKQASMICPAAPKQRKFAT